MDWTTRAFQVGFGLLALGVVALAVYDYIAIFRAVKGWLGY